NLKAPCQNEDRYKVRVKPGLITRESPACTISPVQMRVKKIPGFQKRRALSAPSASGCQMLFRLSSLGCRTSDIEQCARWTVEIAMQQLQESRVGIICLTPENLTEPWILFGSSTRTGY